jgi:hypothetical protein
MEGQYRWNDTQTRQTWTAQADMVTVWETSHGWKYADYSAPCLIKNHTFEKGNGCRSNSTDPRIRYTAFSQVISWLQCRVAIDNGDPEVLCQRHIGCVIQDIQAGEELQLLYKVRCGRSLKEAEKAQRAAIPTQCTSNGQAHHASTDDSNVEHVRRGLDATNLLGATLRRFHREESVQCWHPALGAHETSTPLPRRAAGATVQFASPTQGGLS